MAECYTRHGDRARLRRTGLSVEELVKYVADDGAGGTAVFVGTTRDSFEGEHDHAG